MPRSNFCLLVSYEEGLKRKSVGWATRIIRSGTLWLGAARACFPAKDSRKSEQAELKWKACGWRSWKALRHPCVDRGVEKGEVDEGTVRGPWFGYGLVWLFLSMNIRY